MSKNSKKKLDAKQSEAVIATTQLACENAAKNTEQDKVLERSNKNDIATANALKEIKESNDKEIFQLKKSISELKKKFSLLTTVATVISLTSLVMTFVLK